MCSLEEYKLWSLSSFGLKMGLDFDNLGVTLGMFITLEPGGAGSRSSIVTMCDFSYMDYNLPLTL